ncbi:MAG: 16S rRNA (adenine(1518)-N(6)/adenine(1519)-N(6))-dimethyltransferase RsmA [Ignavibacteria bacterium]|nr:16S rRNA (adenine(1518)-N(6)/adenine(1519)-N(6))-dimethyltransferase RsmA [Ignavibacteria bacterium]
MKELREFNVELKRELTNASDKFQKYRPKKFLGQNFLVDENIAKKIVASLDIQLDDYVIEIGPGQSSLTKYLITLTNNFVAVELDKYIVEKLRAEGKIDVIHKDFLDLDFEKDIPKFMDKSKKLKIIGNIPYNITSQILFMLFDNSERVDSALLMMQKEVAKRLTAVPNTKDYGILAIQTQVFTTPKLLFNVPPTAFFPKPKIDSTVVKFEFHKAKHKIENYPLFKSLVKASFGQRRKTMRNSLKKFFEDNKLSFDNFDFDFSRRAESVSIDEYITLNETINKQLF